ncbi:hypothetical protein LNR29_004640 [Vibrio parahaemolyticus]|nr:hypothetical protein [Vibrio parahaemolyticus]EHK5158313.1 hypothetical protein [Vibrio parahaemolyticus]EHZ7320412.1 hypothetical protein [Vibrio parahaemolyticus]EIA4668600.1 hypothetical protein [Vibrio parahaemolyticus]EIC2729686.1 hypothetical protein [Vibrio parahaemolyticus]
MSISLEELKKVSYLKIDMVDDRAIPMQFCHHPNGEWESWIDASGTLIKMQMVDVMDGCYFAKSPAKSTDVHLKFISLLLKKAYFKDLVHFERGIAEDINNLCTSIEKIELFHEVWLSNPERINWRFVTTEIEYIFKVCRSIFDLLQEIVYRIWERFEFLDKTTTKKKLRKSFREMLYKSGELSTTKEIAERFNIPETLAQFYTQQSEFFVWLRDYRDKIVHGGQNVEHILILDEGFAVAIDQPAFEGLHIWDITEIKNNRLGSLRALLAYATLNTISAVEQCSTILQQIVQFPPDIAPEYEVFIRGGNLSVLHDLYTYAEGNEWKKI